MMFMFYSAHILKRLVQRTCINHSIYISYHLFCQGIEYLVEHGLLSHTPEDVAEFLSKGEGLNKTAIGDYLGER